MRPYQFLYRGAAIAPDKICIQDHTGVKLTYGEAVDYVNAVAATFTAWSVDRPSRVAILSPNRADAFLCALGVTRAGAAWVPLNPILSPEEIARLASALKVTDMFFHSSYSEAAAILRGQIPELGLVCLDATVPIAPSLEDWHVGDAALPSEPAWDDEADVLLVGTGGTTGAAKGVRLSARNIETLVATALWAMPYADPPVYLAAAPLTHGAGVMTLPVLSEGGRIVVIPRATADAILPIIPLEKVTTLFLPPTAIYALLDHPRCRHTDFTSLRYFMYGAAPISATRLTEAIAMFGHVMAEIYGQTEAPMLLSFLSPREHFNPVTATPDPERLASCGRPTPFVQVAILDDEGRQVAANVPGEIAVRGGLVTPGYFENEAATISMRQGEWWLTGDIGAQDRSGYLRIIDRKRDMIISGGFNIYPSEVEQALYLHHAVQDAAVIGVSDAYWGEMVIAVVVLKNGQVLSETDVLSHCRSKLGSVRTPKRVEFWATLPLTAVGKIDKKEVRARCSAVI